MYQRTTNSPEETIDFSMRVADYLQAGDILTLSGDLGAGKTVFAKGIARGLGVTATVNSPTFTIVKEYHGGRLPLYHMDVYRISDDEDIGLEDYFSGSGVCLVEWAENIPSWLPEDVLSVAITCTGAHTRAMIFQPGGKRAEELCKEIFDDEHIGD